MPSDLSTCAICGGTERTVIGTVEGYVAGPSFQILECCKCESQTALALSSENGLGSLDELYDAIYKSGKRLYGYNRYYRYSRIVKNSKKPLRHLSMLEDMYWAVSKIVNSRQFGSKSASVIEVGSGLGYLTAALRSINVDAFGIDISEVAIKQAVTNFGPWFCPADILDPHTEFPKIPDLIVCLEMIEHMHNPMDLVDTLIKLLPINGQLLISTPNRSMWSKSSLWQTDLPPVHLHWISEMGLVAMAKRANCSLEFVDFESFNKFSRKRRRVRDSRTPSSSKLTGDLLPVRPTSEVRDRILSSRFSPILQLLVRKIVGITPTQKHRSDSLVVVLTKSAAN